MPERRHKVFVSFYHDEDEPWRRRWEELFGGTFINKSVSDGAIDSSNGALYTKRLIRQNYVDSASVLVVLVGPHTYCRKHVDWEISAALNKKAGGYSGLLGICLPTHPDYGKKTANNVPPRLVDNIVSGYAKFYDWTDDVAETERRVQVAFTARIDKSALIANERVQFKRNRC